MKVRVKLFAAARELAGTDEIELELLDRANFGELRQNLVAAVPRLKSICERALFAADARYASDRDAVPEKVEIALIPPVSGG